MQLHSWLVQLMPWHAHKYRCQGSGLGSSPATTKNQCLQDTQLTLDPMNCFSTGNSCITRHIVRVIIIVMCDSKWPPPPPALLFPHSWAVHQLLVEGCVFKTHN